MRLGYRVRYGSLKGKLACCAPWFLKGLGWIREQLYLQAFHLVRIWWVGRHGL